MNKRKLKLEKYGISSGRYKELCGFCEQYPEAKKKLSELSFGVKAIQYSDMPKSHNNNSQVEDLAIKRVRYSKICDLIERTANQVDEYYAKYLIKNLCYQVPLTYLITCEDMPTGTTAYYERRRLFFYLLDKNKKD